MLDDKMFPVKRIGNEKNPKILILLSNPGGNPKNYKRLPEYVMDKDGVYKDANMCMSDSREYVEWWDNVLTITDKYGIKESEVLALECYPYHTVGSADIPKYKNWDKYSTEALEENKKLLEKFINQNVLVFGYYWGNWVREVKDLESYRNFYKSKNTMGQAGKIKELEEFLKKQK